MTGMIEALYKRLLLAAHPVGCVYQSTEATSPAELFGGKWEKIEGRFLLAANGTYPRGSVGGATSHTHGVSQIRANFYIDSGYINYHWFSGGTSWEANNDLTIDGSQNSHIAKERNGGVGVRGYTDEANTLPPYFAVYMWRRTS